MTSARVQPFCKKHNISIDCFDGFRICLKSNTERNIALHMFKSYFCLVWKSIVKSFNKVIEELKTNFKVVDNVRSDKHVENFIENEDKPKKIQSHLTNTNAYDLETFSTDRAIPYANRM